MMALTSSTTMAGHLGPRKPGMGTHTAPPPTPSHCLAPAPCRASCTSSRAALQPACASTSSSSATTPARSVLGSPSAQAHSKAHASSCRCSQCAGLVERADSSRDACLDSSPRRAVLLGAAALLAASGGGASQPGPAHAVAFAPPGFRTQDDKLDGYTFFYPDGWLPVTSSGNDCFFRNPRNIEENCFVDITSPTSSKFNSVTDLGTPEQTARRTLDQYLNKEFMSTRLGIRREGQVLYADSRQGPDGRTYYDIGIRMSSYGSSNPYVATQGEVMQQYGLEWDRVLLTTLGVANKRLYELRLQTAQPTYESSKPKLDQIRNSFSLREVDTAGS